MTPKYRFNRNEFAGSLGDLGTILPLALGMIMVNGLSPMGVFFSMGLFYTLTGVYYGLTVPVEPMKVIGAYAIATAMSVQQIQASVLLMAVTLALIAATGSIDKFGRYIPKSVIRGIQLSTGILLMVKGAEMIGGHSALQEIKNLAEPYLNIQSLGPLAQDATRCRARSLALSPSRLDPLPTALQKFVIETSTPHEQEERKKEARKES